MISKNIPNSPSLDYESLRTQGIETLQQIAGEVWTDYNLTDPGVTMLEMLCYTLTDLAYRARFPMADLLANGSGSSSSSSCATNALSWVYTARQVLPSQPVTPEDFRKLIIDQEGIRNAWLEPFGEKPSGQYTVQLQFESEELNNYTMRTPVTLKPKGVGQMDIAQTSHSTQSGSFVIADPYQISITFPFFQDLSPIWYQTFSSSSSSSSSGGTQNLSTWPISKITADWQQINPPPSTQTSYYDFVAPVTVTFAEQTTLVCHLKLKIVSESLQELLKNPDNLNAVKESIAYRLETWGVRKEFQLFYQKVQRIKPLVERVQQVVNANRNLSQVFTQYAAVGLQEIGVNADIEITLGADPQAVLDRICQVLAEALNPTIGFQSLEQLQAKGLSPAEIFQGPLLRHGFIEDQALTSLAAPGVLYCSDFNRLLMAIPEVQSVTNLSLTNFIHHQPQQPHPQTEYLTLGDVTLYKPVLSATQSHLTLTRCSQNQPLPLQVAKTISQVLKAQSQTIKPPVPEPPYDCPVPRGKNREVQEYSSIQNAFPPNYGLGDGDLGSDASPQRQAQAKQLKAYLLVFEQLMADYLSQLGQVKQLLAMSYQPKLFANGKQPPTYFFQPLYQVPGVQEVLKGFCESSGISWEQFQQQPNAYVKGLKQIVDRQDHAQLELLLNYSSAFFGQDWQAYQALLSGIVFADNEAAKASSSSSSSMMIQDFQLALRDELALKATFLQHYPQLGYQRGQGFNTAVGNAWPQQSVGGFVRQLGVLLGVPEALKWTLSQSMIQGPSGSEGSGFYLLEHIFLAPLTEIFPNAPSLDAKETVLMAPLPESSSSSSSSTSSSSSVSSSSSTNSANSTSSSSSSPSSSSTTAASSLSSSSSARAGTDPYAFQMSLFFPNWYGRWADVAFQRYVEEVVIERTPAHIVPYVCWVGKKTMPTFESAYQKWLTQWMPLQARYPMTPTAAQQTALLTARNNLVEVVNGILSVGG